MRFKGQNLQVELDKVREDRDRNWGWFAGLCEILNVAPNFDLAKAELEKLVSIEDKLQMKEGQLQEANTKITDLEQKIKALEEQHIGLEDDNSKLNVLAKEQEKTIGNQGLELKTLSSELQELKKGIQTEDGGLELIIKGIKKLFLK